MEKTGIYKILEAASDCILPEVSPCPLIHVDTGTACSVSAAALLPVVPRDAVATLPSPLCNCTVWPSQHLPTTQATPTLALGPLKPDYDVFVDGNFKYFTKCPKIQHNAA